KLQAELQTKTREVECLTRQIFGWEEWQKAKAQLPRIQKELQQVDRDMETAAAQIKKLEADLGKARNSKSNAEKLKLEAENEFNALMSRFNECIAPEWIKSVSPDEPIPDDFDTAIGLYLNRQKQL